MISKVANPKRQQQVAFFLCDNPHLARRPCDIAKSIGCTAVEAKLALSRLRRSGKIYFGYKRSQNNQILRNFRQAETTPISLHPLYEEFVNFCAALKKDHPELQYEFKREKTQEGEKISSVTFQNPTLEVEKTIVSMMTSIADSIDGESR